MDGNQGFWRVERGGQAGTAGLSESQKAFADGTGEMTCQRKGVASMGDQDTGG